MARTRQTRRGRKKAAKPTGENGSKSEDTSPDKKVEDVKLETEKKVEDLPDEAVNGHEKAATKEEPSENATAEETKEKGTESTENSNAEETANKRKFSGAEKSAEAAAEGVSPEKKAKLADSPGKTKRKKPNRRMREKRRRAKGLGSNHTAEAEVTAGLLPISVDTVGSRAD